MDDLERVGLMRRRVIEWYRSMEVPQAGEGVHTTSAYNLDLHNRGMLLAATYNATNCLVLLEAYDDIADTKRQSIINFFNAHLAPDGFYKMPGMKQVDVYYPSMEYDNFHITNYTVGALSSLKADGMTDFAFLKDYDSAPKLDRWLAARDLTNPWSEGNYIVNLASFYLCAMRRAGGGKYEKLLNRLVRWHESMQDSTTGYWHAKGAVDMVSAMAGASHDFHIYFCLNRPLRHYRQIVDHCLTILDNGVSSACLDIDVVDVLANLYQYGYRAEDIKAYLRRKLHALLDFQNADGGFADVTQGTRMFDGWQVYREPQGLSNCFATWFRCAAIGMICCVLYPETAGQWHFRDTIGMGYFNKDYLRGVDFEKELRTNPPRAKRIWEKALKPVTPVQAQEKTAEHSAEELAKTVCEAFNAKNLSVFEKPATFAFKISNLNGSPFAIHIENGKAEVTDYREGIENIKITISDRNLIRITGGKLMPVVAYATKRLAVAGDMTLALKMQNLFQ